MRESCQSNLLIHYIKVGHPELVSSLTKAGNGDWGHSLAVVDMLSTQEVGNKPPARCTHTRLYGRDSCSCVSGEPSLSTSPWFHSCNSLHEGKILRSWGPPPWLQGLSPPPLIDGHLGQRCSGLLSPGTALLSNLGSPVLWVLLSFPPHSNFYAWLYFCLSGLTHRKQSLHPRSI